MTLSVEVENKLAAGERDINVYHHYTRSAHIISHHSSVTLSLQNAGENDYLHISVLRGPGYLWRNSIISLPSWADFDFSWQGKLSVTHSGDAKRTLLKILPGPPTWELKITGPTGLCTPGPGIVGHRENIIVSDNGTAEGG